MFEQGNIDLDAIEVEFDDGEEVCGDQNCERDKDSFPIINFLPLWHPNRCFPARTSLTESKPEYNYGVL